MYVPLLGVPVFQVYEFAPVAFKVTVLPKQTTLEEAAATTVGKGATLTVQITEALTHPAVEEPITLYVVFAKGDTVALPP